ncbi:MAG: hypothetical protein LQ340_002128 [Diploschistes diacapsis]|nr:MAG: hypothetical protein LQ340_002128 [Diploschistes diacapsis]
MVLRKDQLEASLQEEKKLIQNGKLKDDNPLDLSESFRRLCDGCRRNDLKACQEAITSGANINARDEFDYTPLILASLCGHYEVAQVLLESGALCERDTFQGERCIYSALNDRMRNLLLAYDYSKSTDPLQPLASHIFSLLTREHPKTSDIVITSADESFNLHKFILAARCPYFQKKLTSDPDTSTWKLPSSIPPQAFEVAIKYVYLGELPRDVGGGPGTGFSEEEVLEGIDKISKQLEIQSLWDGILENNDRRLARQNRAAETARGRAQLDAWFRDNVIRHKVVIDTSKANNVKWDRNNGIYADILLRADEISEDLTSLPSGVQSPAADGGIPIGPPSLSAPSTNGTPDHRQPAPQKSTLFPTHRAMLLRSDYFTGMFSSGFLEAQETPYLHIVTVDCTPDVLEAVLAFLYTEKADFPLDLAIDVLFAADLLLIERLKNKAALVISTLGSGGLTQTPIQQKPQQPSDATAKLERNGLMTDVDGDANPNDNLLDPFETLHAAWELRVPRLETFIARFFAYRLERYVDLPEFAALIRESAARIKNREETDSIELVDDIRHYLSERFRLRFEGEGIAEMLEGEGAARAEGVEGRGREDGELKLRAGEDGKPGKEGEVGGLGFENAVGVGTGNVFLEGEIRTLDGEIAGDEFAADAMNYQMLLGKIEALLERLELDG